MQDAHGIARRFKRVTFARVTFAFAILAGLQVWAANAQTITTAGLGSQVQEPAAGMVRPAAANQPIPNKGEKYYIEFRSRYAQAYGHAFVVFGRGNGPGKKITPDQIAGLHPATDSPIPFWVGHVVPVASETGASEGDTDEIYVSARYRVLLTKAEYDKAVAYIRKLQKTKTLWQEMVYNCNSFVGDIATFVGLKTPLSSLVTPQTYITELRDLNEGRPRGAIAQDVRPASPSRHAVQ
jgi:hypothetical protein